MEQTAREVTEKEREDRQWNAYHNGGARNGRAPNGEATAKQKAYIRGLAAARGIRVDLTSIDTREKASRVIERLKGADAGQSNGRVHKRAANNVDVRDRKVAFGLATKLVAHRYAVQNRAINTPRFWEEVEQLHKAYEARQEVALNEAFQAAAETAA